MSCEIEEEIEYLKRAIRLIKTFIRTSSHTFYDDRIRMIKKISKRIKKLEDKE